MYVLFGKHYFDGIDFPMEDAIHDSNFDEFQFGVAQDRNRLMAVAPDHRATIREIRESTSPKWYRPGDELTPVPGTDPDSVEIA